MERVFDIHKVGPRFKRRYQELKERRDLVPENRELFLEWIEYKKDLLENQYGKTESSLLRIKKTLLTEMIYLYNIDKWFKKPLRDITAKDIKEIYQKIENNELRTISGKKISESTKNDYYTRIFKGGLFSYIQKDEIAKKIILRKFMRTEDVRYFEYEDLLKMVSVAETFEHRLFMWLAFDTGVEAGALLQLLPSDFTKHKEDGTEYYVLHMRKEIEKKSRSKRNIYIFFNETGNLLDIALSDKTKTKIFSFEGRSIQKTINKYSKKADIRVKPSGDYVKPKDFRSSCATYFLKKKWTTDEIKARLGHAPSSRVIDKYVSYFGLNQKKRIIETKELDMSNYKELYAQIQEELRKIQHENKAINKKLEKYEDFLSEKNLIKLEKLLQSARKQRPQDIDK